MKSNSFQDTNTRFELTRTKITYTLLYLVKSPSLLVVRATYAAALRTRVTATTCGRPCWLSVAAHGRMATVPVRHAGSGLKVIEAQYCMLLLCPYGTIMGWPSRAGPRAGPSTLRCASAWRRRRGSPRRAARASPLRRAASRAPWARLRFPVPSPRPPWRRSSWLRSTSARRRRRGSTRRAARASPLRFSARGPVGPARIPDPSPQSQCRSKRRRNSHKPFTHIQIYRKLSNCDF
jgi:hypothetical protein